jgi:hypothetical protein
MAEKGKELPADIVSNDDTTSQGRGYSEKFVRLVDRVPYCRSVAVALFRRLCHVSDSLSKAQQRLLAYL